MSNEKQETIEDIVAEMRNEGHAGDESCLEWVGAKLLSYADRFEAAAKREIAELKSKMNDVVCENEALRDACGTCGAKREVAELRECLKEAIKKQCKHKECKDNECFFVEFGKENECIVHEWCKVLKGASND